MTRSATALSTGGKLLSNTTTVNVCVALNGGEPLSVTRTAITFVPGPCPSVGVQTKTPLVGLMNAFVGAPALRLNVSTFAGRSASTAVLVKLNIVPSKTVRFEIAEKV